MEDNKKITLECSDGEKVEISLKAAQKSNLIKGILDDFQDEAQSIRLNNVKSNVFKKIKEYLEHYENEDVQPLERPLKSQNFKDCVDEWDYHYMDVDIDLTFDIISAANYMDIKPLLSLASAKVATIIKFKTIEDIKKAFNIKKEFTPEEEAKIIDANDWVMKDI